MTRSPTALSSGRASSGSTVSNTCGSSPGPGTLCAWLPAGMGTPSGAPGVAVTVNDNQVVAATPGRSSYPMARASISTEPRSVAVPRNPSLAIRS
ncbi:hypothetical protein [Micromonospora sp. 4G55]|uniref:hypothetical protein n=1 Tax=Micromonospora sp. 4G55 TaxID=2806102 RepID=UPI001A530B20|nr:hypothetical protein [Micromonospora sp. 4G55]MBM0260468.1 hypothetical protein [Micromonospora sp. 4G55]